MINKQNLFRQGKQETYSPVVEKLVYIGDAISIMALAIALVAFGFLW